MVLSHLLPPSQFAHGDLRKLYDELMYDGSHSPVAEIVAIGEAVIASPAKAGFVRSDIPPKRGIGVKTEEGRTRKFSFPRSLLNFLINHLVSAEGGGETGWLTHIGLFWRAIIKLPFCYPVQGRLEGNGGWLL